MFFISYSSIRRSIFMADSRVWLLKTVFPAPTLLRILMWIYYIPIDFMWMCVYLCVCVEDNPKNKGKDMLQQWSMAKKTIWISVYLCVCVWRTIRRTRGRTCCSSGPWPRRPWRAGWPSSHRLSPPRKWRTRRYTNLNYQLKILLVPQEEIQKAYKIKSVSTFLT